MAYPIQQLRDLFSIAKDVKDDDLQKAFYEADSVGMRQGMSGWVNDGNSFIEHTYGFVHWLTIG